MMSYFSNIANLQLIEYPISDSPIQTVLVAPPHITYTYTYTYTHSIETYTELFQELNLINFLIHLFNN